MSLSPELLQNSWKVASRSYINRTGEPMRVAIESQFMPFLISTRNRAANTIATAAANNLRRVVNADGKDVYEVVVKWPQKLDANAPRQDTSNGFCGIDGQSITYNAKNYYLNRVTSASVLIDGNIGYCSEETRQQYMDDHYQALVQSAVFNLARDVEDEFFAKISPTQYRHIGNLPTLQAGTPRLAGESLPLFQLTNSRINGVGDQILERDRELGGIMDRVFISDYSLKAYINYKEMSGLNDNGFDFSKLMEINRAGYLRSNRIQNNTGLQRPVLSLPVGAVQFVSVAEFGINPEQSGDLTKTAVTDPVFGLQWNLITQTIPCEGRHLKTQMTLELVWALVVNPTCDPNDLRLNGTNGIHMYNIVCTDETVCSLPRIDALYNSASTPKPECGDVDAEFCVSPCNVSLSGFVSSNGDDYIATANAVTSQGAAVVSYAWTLNGSPLVATTRVITLDNSTLSSGDVIAVTVTDSLGCVATNSFVMDNGCPELVYVLDSNVLAIPNQIVANGAVINAVAFAAPVGDLQISLAVGNLGLAAGVVTSGTATGTGAGVVSSDFPATLETGDEAAVQCVAAKTIGAKQIVFTIASNDCAAPAFSITVNYTISL